MDINFLKGKKIGITALDLEQEEHRGIAAVTKSLIQSLKNYGADILRAWVASSDYAEDLRIDKNILAQHAESYRKIRNTFRFILGNIKDNFEVKWKSINKINTSIKIPIRLSISSNNTLFSQKLEKKSNPLNILSNIEAINDYDLLYYDRSLRP